MLNESAGAGLQGNSIRAPIQKWVFRKSEGSVKLNIQYSEEPTEGASKRGNSQLHSKYELWQKRRMILETWGGGVCALHIRHIL